MSLDAPPSRGEFRSRSGKFTLRPDELQPRSAHANPRRVRFTGAILPAGAPALSKIMIAVPQMTPRTAFAMLYAPWNPPDEHEDAARGERPRQRPAPVLDRADGGQGVAAALWREPRGVEHLPPVFSGAAPS